MTDDIAELWDDATSIMDYTDTDLQISRNYSSRIYDPEYEIHRLVEVVQDKYGFENPSETIDLASSEQDASRMSASQTVDFVLRIELAGVLDRDEIMLDRDVFDVAYTIPPKGWVGQQTFEKLAIDDDTSGYDDPHLSYSTPSVCSDMMNRIRDETDYEYNIEIIRDGLKRVAGRR